MGLTLRMLASPPQFLVVFASLDRVTEYGPSLLNDQPPCLRVRPKLYEVAWYTNKAIRMIFLG